MIKFLPLDFLDVSNDFHERKETLFTITFLLFFFFCFLSVHFSYFQNKSPLLKQKNTLQSHWFKIYFLALFIMNMHLQYL